MKRLLPRFILALLFLTPLALAAEPFFVDLAPVANSGLEDDGVPDNNKGGWTDEGINDLFIFPPIPAGEVTRNGYRFRLLDPSKNGGKAILVLKGERRGRDYPAAATLAVPSVKGPFVYFLQNAAASVPSVSKEEVVATCAVKYADGSSAEIPMRDGIEIRQWWTGSWWDNHGAESWPIFMGQNLYTQKYSKYIGVWATQWKNPNPDRPITALEYRSAGKAVPALFAVTITDEDWFVSPRIKEDFKRPDGVPSGYFDGKLAQENRLIFEEMVRQKLAVGMRSVEVIRPDLLAVTLDAAVSGGSGQGEEKAAAFQKPEKFLVRAEGDPTFKEGVHPAQVGRQTFKHWTGDIGSFRVNQLFWHTYYLKLPAPLRAGTAFRVEVEGLSTGMVSRIEAKLSDRETVTPVIKVNQAGYTTLATRRYAYLGWWAGDLGAVDFSTFTKFQVVREGDGKVALEGDVRPRPNPDATSGETVGEMDLSALKEPGRYFLVVPGLGRSSTFGVGAETVKAVYVAAMRGFLVQRCGCELPAKNTEFPRPACHVKSYENGHLVGGLDEKYEGGKLVPAIVPHRPDEPVREIRGGYHDAGDFDVFYFHLMAAEKTMDAYEICPTAFRDGDLNLPESGNGIPDVLDEVTWGLKLYADQQQPDGGIISGRTNDEDYGRNEWKKDGAKEFGDLPSFGNIPPCNASANLFAAVAAHSATLLQPFDAPQAAKMLERARKAYAWGKAHQTTPWERQGIAYGPVPWKRAWVLAAARLFEATGEKEYHDDFLQLFREGEAMKGTWNNEHPLPYFHWPYATSKRPGLDPVVQKACRDYILKRADGTVKNTDKWAYRMGSGRDIGGWGNLVGGGYYAGACLLAHQLTGEAKYLDAAALNADYQLGANPLSRSFITGVGARPPLHPELRGWLYAADGHPAPGIPVFGPGGGPKSLGGSYPAEVPQWRCWLDNQVSALHSEFGIEHPMGDAAMLYGALWALESAAAKDKPR
jgi:endoglucanase